MAAGLNPATQNFGVRFGIYSHATPLLDPTTGSATITNTGATGWADVTHDARITINIVNGATNGYVVEAIEGSVDGTNFTPVPYRAWTSAAGVAITYQTGDTDLTLAASDKAIVTLDPTVYIRFVRVNTKTANAIGTQITVYHST